MGAQGCVRHRWVEPRGRNERERVSQICSVVARVSAEKHLANYQAARALMSKGRNAGEGAAGLSKNSANKGARKSALKKGETKTLAIAGFVSEVC